MLILVAPSSGLRGLAPGSALLLPSRLDFSRRSVRLFGIGATACPDSRFAFVGSCVFCLDVSIAQQVPAGFFLTRWLFFISYSRTESEFCSCTPQGVVFLLLNHFCVEKLVFLLIISGACGGRFSVPSPHLATCLGPLAIFPALKNSRVPCYCLSLSLAKVLGFWFFVSLGLCNPVAGAARPGCFLLRLSFAASRFGRRALWC
jgi:hypothetical protein